MVFGLNAPLAIVNRTRKSDLIPNLSSHKYKQTCTYIYKNTTYFFGGIGTGGWGDERGERVVVERSPVKVKRESDFFFF